MLATFALLFFGGFTINLMTLGGLALGAGLMLDGSVVVLENVFRRYQERGEEPAQAAIAGSREVASAVIPGTVTTLTIFLPLIFLQGVTGVLFRELAYVIMFSLGCALLVALALVPMLASKLLQSEQRRQDGSDESSLEHGAEAAFTSLENGYRDLLSTALNYRLAVILFALAIFSASRRRGPP